MGAANQELMCDLGERHGIRVVHGRHESGVVGMADGYARFGGRLGVATVTSGPGVTNTATSLAVARAHRSSVLLLAGDSPRGDVDNPQYLEQELFTRLCGGAAGRIEAPEATGDVLSRAAHTLASGAPYALHMPLDVQQLTAPGCEAADLRPVLPPPGQVKDQAGLAKAVHALCRARQPVVLAGRGAQSASGPLAELARMLGAPLVTTLLAAGLFAGDPREAGVAGVMSDGRAQQLLQDADLVLVVGASLHPLAAQVIHRRAAPPVLVRVDTAPPSFSCLSFEADLRGDAESVVRALLAELPARLPSAMPDGVVPPLPDADLDRGVDAGVHVLDALDELRARLPEQRLMVIGGGHAALSACQRLPATGPRDFTCVSTDFGAIGQALPVAIGACFARPGHRVYNVTADGELMMSLAELHTAVRYRLPLTVIVLNDHGFGQERHNLDRAGSPGHYAAHPSPDLAAVARAMGATGYRITDPDGLYTLKKAMDHRPEDGVVLVDIRIDPVYLNPASAHVAAAMAQHAHRS
jgi:thiamine pyrophosphate-dependent acetolactate synthase large subunit-like protein